MKFKSAAFAVLLAVGKIKSRSILMSSDATPEPKRVDIIGVPMVEVDNQQLARRTIGFLDGNDRVFSWMRGNNFRRKLARRSFSEPMFREFLNDLINE